jgi:hypothetical protein
MLVKIPVQSTHVLAVEPRVRSLELLSSVGDELLEDTVGVTNH